MINIGAIGFVGSFHGLSIELMAVGAMAGVAAVALQKAVGRIRALGSVMVSMLLAAGLAPVLAHAAAAEYAPGIERGVVETAIAVLLGAAWPWLAPVAGTLLKDAGAAIMTKIRRVLGVEG
ncbi:hypothetical protein [Brachymonas sp. J145]|uniref:hypothetical protein n=1 Tax=Brachymonas sp. J145 TaxID=3116489 RepID=UPI002E75BD07|nr:hypothetical protein [Brachymonas sp. J145]MEE1653731.1 hypothetical protein [Brachymonas sp. J145]